MKRLLLFIVMAAAAPVVWGQASTPLFIAGASPWRIGNALSVVKLTLTATT